MPNGTSSTTKKTLPMSIGTTSVTSVQNTILHYPSEMDYVLDPFMMPMVNITLLAQAPTYLTEIPPYLPLSPYR